MVLSKMVRESILEVTRNAIRARKRIITIRISIVTSLSQIMMMLETRILNITKTLRYLITINQLKANTMLEG